MRKFVIHILLYSIPVFIGIAILFMIPVDKKFAYRFVKGECDNKAEWIYRQIFEEPKNIDIAFLGASHTTCGIMDYLIESELNNQDSPELNIKNFGYCRGGRDIQYIFLKDLFENHSPRLVFIEAMEDEPKKSHPVFGYLAGNKDLWHSAIFFNQQYLTNLWKGLVVRFEFSKHKLLGNSKTTQSFFHDSGYIPSTIIANPSDLANNHQSWEKRLAKKTPGFIRETQIAYSKSYIEKMVKLANQHHCQLVFIYLPEWGSKLEKPLLYNYYKQFADVILPKKSTIEDTNNWKDAGHLNDYGALQITRQTIDYINIFYPDLTVLNKKTALEN